MAEALTGRRCNCRSVARVGAEFQDEQVGAWEVEEKPTVDKTLGLKVMEVSRYRKSADSRSWGTWRCSDGLPATNEAQAGVPRLTSGSHPRRQVAKIRYSKAVRQTLFTESFESRNGGSDRVGREWW